MKGVVNTGPLVFLSKINRLALLQNFGKIIIPKTVLSEIKYKKDDVSVAVSQATGDWLTVKAAKGKNLLKILTNELDGGEAEVICLALEEKAAWVVLDDQDARRYAHRYGLNVIGTLGGRILCNCRSCGEIVEGSGRREDKTWLIPSTHNSKKEILSARNLRDWG